MNYHVPVLLNESVENLITEIDGNYFEGTVGFGGHTEKILERLSKSARLIGTDKDQSAFKVCLDKFKNDKRVQLFNTSFTNIDTICRLESLDGFHGIFLDLGVSSFQLDDVDSGFTYRNDTKIDLRMNKETGHPAYYYLNKLSESQIADILYQFGEEKASRKIAKNIMKERNEKYIENTFRLNAIVENVIGKKNLQKSLSRVYQALRIYVNNELKELEDFLNIAIDRLLPGARLAVITFHSLEDRIVKQFYKYESLTCICSPDTPVCICEKKQRLRIVTRKPIIPTKEEVDKNIRSRSAKLRIAEKI